MVELRELQLVGMAFGVEESPYALGHELPICSSALQQAHTHGECLRTTSNSQPGSQDTHMSSDSLPFFFSSGLEVYTLRHGSWKPAPSFLLLIYNSEMLPIPPLDHILQAVANYAAPYPTYHPLLASM